MLHRHELTFVVVGGLAAVAHGPTLMTVALPYLEALHDEIDR